MDLNLPREVLAWVDAKRGKMSRQAYIVSCLSMLRQQDRAGLSKPEDKKN